MSPELPRRRLLSSGAALAATAVIAAPALKGSTAEGADHTATVIVRWNAKSHKWAKRPVKADFGVVFLSTNDANAPEPTDPQVQAGDVWRRHPDAVIS